MARTTTTRPRRQRKPPIPVMPCPHCGANSAQLARHQYLYRNSENALNPRDRQVFGCAAGLHLITLIGTLALVTLFLHAIIPGVIATAVPLGLGIGAGALFVLWLIWVSVLSFAPPAAVRYTCQQCGRVWQTLLSN